MPKVSVDEKVTFLNTISAGVFVPKERLISPVDGYVFFHHGPALVNQDTIAFKIAPL